MPGRKGKRVSAQLPAAPLAEVVFELRWDLQPAPPPLQPFDPLLFPVVKRFTDVMETAGYEHHVDMVPHPLLTGPYGVVRRFYRNSESPFPLMQIGMGIFATNESSKYQWAAFRTQVISGVKALLSSYPADIGLPLKPNYLELRYVDVFSKDTIGDYSFFDFARTGTTLTFSFPDFLKDRTIFWGDAEGRLFYQHALRRRKDSKFIFDVGSGQNETKQDIIQLNSKVVSIGRGVPLLKKAAPFLTEIRDWLDFAHSVTSPFFRNLVKPHVMKKFSERHGS